MMRLLFVVTFLLAWLGVGPLTRQVAQAADDTCSTGQVMIGGKCRVLGKKKAEEPEVTPDSTDTATEPAQSAEQDCPTGQVMIGGKCRVLGKKKAEEPEIAPESTDTSTEPAQSAEQDCPTGQVMIGGKCRILGKKKAEEPEVTPESTDTATEPGQAAEQDCPTGQVMVGGKCRVLGKKKTNPDSENAEKPADANDENNDQDASTEAAPDEGYRAGSWGGIVRAGPGQKYARIASLAEGQPIEVLEQASEPENGYPWFKIRFGQSQIGYQWGGIMCAYDKPREGLFETCRDSSADSQQDEAQQPQAQQPDDDAAVWQSKLVNDRNNHGALISQLLLGIPETDAVQFFATCSETVEHGLPVILMTADVNRRSNGKGVNLHFVTDESDISFFATIMRSQSGEGMEGYRVVVGVREPMWRAMLAGKSLSYGETGKALTALSTIGSRQSIIKFLAACDRIAK